MVLANWQHTLMRVCSTGWVDDTPAPTRHTGAGLWLSLNASSGRTKTNNLAHTCSFGVMNQQFKSIIHLQH